MGDIVYLVASGAVTFLAVGLVLWWRQEGQVKHSSWEVLDVRENRLRDGSYLDPTLYGGSYDKRTMTIFFSDEEDADRYIERVDRLRTIQTCEAILERSAQEPGTLWLSEAERRYILLLKQYAESELEMGAQAV